MSIRYELRDSVAVVALDNPPVNGLGHATRTGVVEAVERANGDPAIAAIVLIGAGKLFSGGADIREFNTPKAMAEPTLGTVIRTVEASGKPVDRRDRRDLHGRRPRARVGLSLARGDAGRRDRVAGSEAGHPAGRRRDAAAAARGRGRDGAADDRQRRERRRPRSARQQDLRRHRSTASCWTGRSHSRARSSRKGGPCKRVRDIDDRWSRHRADPRCRARAGRRASRDIIRRRRCASMRWRPR